MDGYGVERQEKKSSTVWIIIAVVSVFLLVGCACIGGIFASILVPNFLIARSMGQMAACESNLKNIATALEMYATDYKGEYPPSLDYLTANLGGQWGSYMKSIPLCPSCEKPYNYQKVEVDGSGVFILYCGGTNAHSATGKVGDGNFPQYTPLKGILLR